MPLWELASTLLELSIHPIYGDSVTMAFSHHEQTEVRVSKEDEIGSFELPSAPSDDNIVARMELHRSITDRTAVAAMRGGRLRRLKLTPSVHKPFAARTLLPSLVSIEVLDRAMAEWQGRKDWQQEAKKLRAALEHTSRHRHKSSQDAEDSLLLTSTDVQGMRAHFKSGGAPRHVTGLEKRTAALFRDEEDEDVHFEDEHLAWLEQDAKLSQQVADAWNAVVKRGEADVVECNCQVCAPQLASLYRWPYPSSDEEEDLSQASSSLRG